MCALTVVNGIMIIRQDSSTWEGEQRCSDLEGPCEGQNFSPSEPWDLRTDSEIPHAQATLQTISVRNLGCGAQELTQEHFTK